MAAISPSATVRPGCLTESRSSDRERLGEKITAWLQAHPRYKLVDIWVTQSSDMSFHCLAITIFYFDPDVPARA